MPQHSSEWHWRLLWLVVAVLAVYGSLYPFRWLDARQPWRVLLTVPAHVSRSDILGNVALFVPIGASGALALRRSRFGSLFVLASGGALAVGLQVAQLWTSGRTAALYDAVWNVAGLVVGLLAARLLSGAPATRLRGDLAWGPATALLVVAAWFGSELLPLVPSLDWQHVKDNLRPLLRGLEGWSTLPMIGAGLRTLVAGEALVVALGMVGALALLPLGGLLLVGKAVVVGQTLDPGVALGVALGVGLILLGQVLTAPRRRLLLILLLPAGMAALALLPFDPYAARLPADWVPFAGLLRGDMLLNAQALAGRLFLYGGLLWLLRVEGVRPLPATVALALWLALLESLQVVLPGQRADLTEPLWALLCGWALALLPAAMFQVAAATPSMARPRPAVIPASDTGPTGWASALRAGACVAALTAVLVAALRLPGLPYNVRELFLLDGAVPVVFVFALAVLWIGASAAWIGRALASGRSPWRFFPLAVLAATQISLGLLYCSVTAESILDIAGSNNLFHFVTQRDIWGPMFRELFLLLGPGPVAVLERPVRYAALVGPLWFFLAFAFAVSAGLRGRRALLVVMAAAPWLWLCKGIAFDGSSTDNLNELIARQGLWGTGGGGYLYALLALVCASAALLAHRWRRRWLVAPAWLVVLAAVPLGWWLLTHGLEAQVHKYERVFSGWQFLLGPDRDHALPEAVLFWRWAAVQLGLAAAFAVGAFAAPRISRLRVASVRDGEPSTPAALAASVGD